MGTTDSKQKLGERVIAARRKLDEDIKLQSSRSRDLQTKSPQTMKAIIKSIAESFKSCSPFLEPTLLIAWQADPEQCKNIIINSCKKVLSAPIIREEYEWFQQYVFPSSIWMFKTNTNRFMYQELMDVAHNMSLDIIDSMNSIYNHLQYHPKWTQLMNIQNETVISRQDDKKVGLLQENGIRDILEIKENDETSDDIQSFIDSNLAINILTTTAKNINVEFQNYIKTTMSHYGNFKAGPMKKVGRCLSKLENDYQDAKYPKAAKLLDLIRCSVTFNTVDQLIAGYTGLMSHISKKSSDIELARIKNGFLDKTYDGGYRDIKINVVYHSSINIGINMVCEVQLILNQYLHEKKLIHKLYSIIRQQEYFKMTTTRQTEYQGGLKKDMNDLEFVPVLNVSKVDGTQNKFNQNGKCSVDQDLGLLAIESYRHISAIDINRKKMIFIEKRKMVIKEYANTHSHSHNFIDIDNKKYLSVQTADHIIKFFSINKFNDDYKFEEDRALRISWLENDKINCCKFDRKFENIIYVKNCEILEKRAVKDNNQQMVIIKLEQKIKQTSTEMLSLSNSGDLCVIGAGLERPYFYLIDIKNKRYDILTSSNLTSSYSPCFINGDPEYVAVGGYYGQIEIWNVEKKVSIKVIEINSIGKMVSCINSANNILAVGSDDKKMSLWDVRNWNMFYSQQFEMEPTSVHLTADSKYLTIGGWNGEKSVILEIK